MEQAVFVVRHGESVHIGDDAIKTLASIMRNVEMPPQARVAAANGLLDRAFGKPVQALTGEGGGPIAVQTIVEHHHESS